MNVIEDRIARPRVLLVLLPGAGDSAALYARNGFIARLRESGWPADALAVDARSDLYLDKSVIPRLHDEVIAPELAARPLPLWIAGISLGGMGAALYARRHPGAVSGLLLLAPFFAVRGTIAEVTRAGGLETWNPGEIAADDDERALLWWLKQRGPGPRENLPVYGPVHGSTHGPAHFPEVWLGYGAQDRYAPASALLAGRLPPKQVFTIPGGHDWPTWSLLWPRLLEAAAASLPG
jgi:pimeloyl-ACP methyl ester carboxylesterase